MPMSEFFDAHICTCPYCGKRFASCEGPECDCLVEAERQDENVDEQELALEWRIKRLKER